MHIFQEENGDVRLQLMDLVHEKILFDFTVPPEKYQEVRAHIIKHLIEYEPVHHKQSKTFFSETIREILLAHHVYETKIDNAVINDAIIEIQKYLGVK